MRTYNSGKNHPKFVDLSGKKIGSITVLDYVLCDMPNGKKKWKWKCRCNCGALMFPETKSLTRSNPVTSCIKCGYKRMGETNTLPDNLSLQNRIFRHQKRGARIRGYIWELSFDQFQSLMKDDCHYCGKKPQINEGEIPYFRNNEFKRNGIDRVDNNIGYTLKNCVPCCSVCNRMKLTQTKEEFLEAIKNCYKHSFTNKSSTTIP